jgi:hypothetical protein
MNKVDRLLLTSQKVSKKSSTQISQYIVLHFKTSIYISPLNTLNLFTKPTLVMRIRNLNR